jgi:transcriptional regulator PpsR
VKTETNARLAEGSLPVIAPELLGNIVASTADIGFVLSPLGAIVTAIVNPHHRSFGEVSHWEGRQMTSVLTSESVVKLRDRLAELTARGDRSRAVELNHADPSDWEFPVRYVLHRVDDAGTVLMLGRDLRPIAEMQQQLVRAQLALERDYEAQREIDTRYRVLMEATRDAVVVVSMTSGRISDLNPAAAVILGGSRQDLMGCAIAQEFEGRRRGEFLESMANLAASDGLTPVELVARRSQRRVMVVPTTFRAAGERLLLCRLDPADGGDTLADELGAQLTGLYHGGVEGIVFTDRDGTIRAANEAFLNLTDAASLSAVKGRSLSEFLARGAIDLKVMIDNARRTGNMRLYATKVTTAYDGQVSAEISVTYLNDRPNPFLVFVVRDASRADALRRPATAAPDDGMRNVAELVGASTLKDIVAETTDVVERMCIETAVELTRNNRVAAAEMLGLSRQSLYVKLRKYGLLNRGE